MRSPLQRTAALPKIIYGTAWKEDTTAALVEQALKLGYLGLDTANQKKHYREDYAGLALAKLMRQGLERSQVFLQSKYTYPAGQDSRMPYDPKSAFTQQVIDSFKNTLANLQTDYLDAFLLHGPSHAQGISEADWEVWRAMETLHQTGQVKRIGISNVALGQLEQIYSRAAVKPEIVQNRCFASYGWDREIRHFCRQNQIVYEGFSLLTANPRSVRHAIIREMAARRKVTAEQIVLRFASQIGIVPLTGTTDPLHMKQDLQIFKFELSEAEVEEIEALEG